MKDLFFEILVRLAKKDKSIALVVGDIGFKAIDEFVRCFPERFYNVGVAEQNMIGFATGLALSGQKVVVYSIANFPVLRCYEQIRNDICAHNATVKIVSAGAGLSYESLGMSHHATEDIAVMRALPNMRVIVPADEIELDFYTHAALRRSGPDYIRLARKNVATVHSKREVISWGKILPATKGTADVVLFVCGDIITAALEACSILARFNIPLKIYSIPMIKPIDRRGIVKAVRKAKFVFTLEEHSLIGGLGSTVSEIMAGVPECTAVFHALALPDAFNETIGDHSYLLNKHGLSGKSIAGRIRRIVRSRSS